MFRCQCVKVFRCCVEFRLLRSAQDKKSRGKSANSVAGVLDDGVEVL